MSDSEQWFIIPCPPDIQLTAIAKERQCHGLLYCLYERGSHTPIWLGQSIPALVRCINEKVVTSPERRLHASSLYRLLRRECRRPAPSHKLWVAEVFSRMELDDLNRFLSNFPSIVVVSKSPELWHCNPVSAPEEEDAAGAEGASKALAPKPPAAHTEGARDEAPPEALAASACDGKVGERPPAAASRGAALARKAACFAAPRRRPASSEAAPAPEACSDGGTSSDRSG